MSFTPYLHRLTSRSDLTASEAYEAMSAILSGHTPAPAIAAFLVALRMKGETAPELLGFARAMRECATRVETQMNGEAIVDTCGMGGGACTFNISTIAAFVVAGAGVRVAKHGNRSFSSACGSADVLERLGVRLAVDAATAARAIEHIRIAFLFAPAFHPAMRHAQPARAELKMRTVFNLLGPLCNPANATAQVVGAPDAESARLVAEALVSLGLSRGFVVHGSDGLDEITTTGETLLYDICEGRIFRRTVAPEDFGVAPARLADLAGGSVEHNTEIARRVFAGERGPKRDIVLVNAAAALVAAGRAGGFREAVEIAADSIDSGAAAARLQALAEFTAQS